MRSQAPDGRKRSLWLSQDIVTLMRDTGMRNERELYRMRIENLDWEGRVIFVPDSKTAEGRRRVPMSNRAFEILKTRCGTRREGWVVFPSKRAKSGDQISGSQEKSRTFRRSCSILRQARLWDANSQAHRQSGRGDANDGP
jgi:integrase